MLIKLNITKKNIFLVIIFLVVLRYLLLEIFNSKEFEFELYNSNEKFQSSLKEYFIKKHYNIVNEMIRGLQKSGALCLIYKNNATNGLDVDCEYKTFSIFDNLSGQFGERIYRLTLFLDQNLKFIELNAYIIKGDAL